MEDLNYPVYSFKVKEDGTDTGMIGISLVDEPAIESSFMTFKEQKEIPQFILLKDEAGEYKKELLGAALRPDFPILRKDEAGGYYYGIFEAQTIETIRNKFHKQKNTSEVNLQHDQDLKIDAYLNESYIIATEDQLEAVKNMGLDNIELGSWIVRYKIESDELFQKIVDGQVNVKGFSIEIMLEKELINNNKNNFNQQNNTIMSKFKELVNKFKEVLAEYEEEAPTNEFEDVTVADSGMVLRYTDTGAPVLEVTVDDEGNEETVGAQEGEYILEDGRTLVVDADGNLVEIKDAEEETEPVGEEQEELESDSKEQKEELKSDSKEQKEELEETEGNDLNKTLSELIPTDADGSYSLEVYVSDGKVSFGTLYSYTYKDLKFDKLIEDYENLKQEKTELNKEIEKLKKEPVSKPVFSELKTENKRKNKTEFKSNLEYQLNRLGLDNDE